MKIGGFNDLYDEDGDEDEDSDEDSDEDEDDAPAPEKPGESFFAPACAAVHSVVLTGQLSREPLTNALTNRCDLLHS